MWQPWDGYHKLSTTTVGYNTFWVASLEPGTYDGSETETFNHQVVMERIRGSVTHEGSGLGTGSGGKIIALNWGIFIVPAEIGTRVQTDADMPNLFINEEGDDFPLFDSTLCDASTSDLIPSIHMVDSKAKRRLDVGSRLVMCATIDNMTADATIDVAFGFNLRILWKLR